MSFYNQIGRTEYGELQIEEIGTGKKFTACERNRLFFQDFYAIERFNYATPNGEGKTRNALFRFSLMPDGYTLRVGICDYEQGKKVIEANLDELLKGTAKPEKMAMQLGKLFRGEEQI